MEKLLTHAKEIYFGLVEVKWPYRYRNADLKYAALNKYFYLRSENDVLKLKSTCDYYYQIQGQLALSGLQWCDFVVLTSKSMFHLASCFGYKTCCLLFQPFIFIMHSILC